MQETYDMQGPGAQGFPERLKELEQRIAELEKKVLAMSRAGATAADTPAEEENPEDYRLTLKTPTAEEEGEIETRFGEYGLAWLGNIVLFFGIVFLTQYLTNTGHPILSAVTGLAAVAGILGLSWGIRNSYAYMASMFRFLGLILLFFTVMWLHFFTAVPLVASAPLCLLLLLLVTGYPYFEAIRRRSEGYAVLGLLFAIATSILSDQAHLMFPLVTATAAVAMFLFNRYGWYRHLVLAIVLNYTVFLLWMISNPVMGHPLQAMTGHHYAWIYLALVGAVYSMSTLVKQQDHFPDHLVLTAVIVNGLGFSAVLGLMTLLFFSTGYIWIFTSIAVFCLGFSAVLKYRSPWRYSPALYALYGFVAVSIAFYGLLGVPRVYLMLSLQSLLVVSMALWFRSRIIVVMNLFLFLLLMAAYSAGKHDLGTVNFSFAVVAFLSARIINWQKDRLNIKTDLIRNTYLVILFFTMLYAFYRAVPGQYVTLSWTSVAVLYFLMSIVLKNVKYRYLAMATMIATAVYLFAVDLAKIGMIYRIIAFLFLAIISIAISAYYVRKVKKGQRGPGGDEVVI